MSEEEIEIKKVSVRKGTDHITVVYVEKGEDIDLEKRLIVSAREVVRNFYKTCPFCNLAHDEKINCPARLDFQEWREKKNLELAMQISVSRPHPRVA